MDDSISVHVMPASTLSHCQWSRYLIAEWSRFLPSPSSSEVGPVCGETAVEHDGFCLSTVNAQKEDSCDTIFMEDSYPVSISSQKTQDFLENNEAK